MVRVTAGKPQTANKTNARSCLAIAHQRERGRQLPVAMIAGIHRLRALPVLPQNLECRGTVLGQSEDDVFLARDSMGDFKVSVQIVVPR